MSDKKASLVNKKYRRSSYVTHVIPKKKLLLWVHHSVNMNDETNQLSLLLSQIRLKADLIDTLSYQNNFRNFYDTHIKSKYDDKKVNESDDANVKRYKQKKNVFFCASDEMGGVNTGYIVQNANKPTTATIFSVDMDVKNGKILEIYAMASFNISEQKMAIHVSTLCGNQVLPPSGEGTRLLKLIENVGYQIGLNKVFLDPVESAFQYYEGNRYRLMNEKDSPGTPKSSSSSSSSTGTTSSTGSTSSSSSGEAIQMQKNIRAQKNWNKVRTAYNLGVLLSRTRKSRAARDIKEKYTKIRDSEIAARPSLTGKPINPIGSSLTSVGKGFVLNPAKKTRGIPSAIIKPGSTLKNKHRTMKHHRSMKRHRTVRRHRAMRRQKA